MASRPSDAPPPPPQDDDIPPPPPESFTPKESSILSAVSPFSAPPPSTTAPPPPPPPPPASRPTLVVPPPPPPPVSASVLKVQPPPPSPSSSAPSSNASSPASSTSSPSPNLTVQQLNRLPIMPKGLGRKGRSNSNPDVAPAAAAAPLPLSVPDPAVVTGNSSKNPSPNTKSKVVDPSAPGKAFHGRQPSSSVHLNQSRRKQSVDVTTTSPTARDADDDSDDEQHYAPKEEDQEKFQQTLTKKLTRYEVLKYNKYNMKQKRIVTVDPDDKTLRFFDLKGQCTADFAIKEIDDVGVRKGGGVEAAKRLIINFKQRKAYDVMFSSVAESEDFQKELNKLISEVGAEPMSPGSTRGSISVKGLQNDSGEKAVGVVVSAPSNSEEDDFQQGYTVHKKNKYGLMQKRIIVLHSKDKTFVLLDTLRKFKKDIPLSQVAQLEIPAKTTPDPAKGSKSPPSDKKKLEEGNELNAPAEMFVVFQNSVGQRPFHLYFTDEFERMHFCERVAAMSPVEIKDFSSDKVEDGTVKFSVYKTNRVGVKKKRIVLLQKSPPAFRSFDRMAHYKDIPFDEVLKVEKAYDDPCTARIYSKSKSAIPTILTFADAGTRDRFCAIASELQDRANGVDDARANAPFTVFVGSWNMGGASYDSAPMGDLLPPKEYDIYVMGMQECSDSKRDQWVAAMTDHICQQWDPEIKPDDREYVLLVSAKLWEISVFVLVKQDLFRKCSAVEMNAVATGVGGVLGNKGGVAVSFRVRETSLCFICCHLAARAERLKERRENYHKIVRSLRLGLKDYDVLNQFDHVFWFGDLNYRNDTTFEEATQLVEAKDYTKLASYDQLAQEIAGKNVLYGFKEGSLSFAPTYRWSKSANEWSNKRGQPPSWTDRVLWRSLPALDTLVQDKYTSAPNMMGSDHRPVYSTFTVQHQPLCSFKPPSVDMFGGLKCDFVLHTLKLASTELESTAVLSLHISAAWMNITETTTAASTYEQLKGQWLWPSHVRLLPYISEQSFSTTRHLRIMVVQAPSAKELMEAKTKEERTKAQEKGTVVGYATVALGGVHLNEFTASVTNEGSYIGELSGKIISRVGKNLKKDASDVKSPSAMLKTAAVGKKELVVGRKESVKSPELSDRTSVASPGKQAPGKTSPSSTTGSSGRAKSPGRDADDVDVAPASPRSGGASSLKAVRPSVAN